VVRSAQSLATRAPKGTSAPGTEADRPSPEEDRPESSRGTPIRNKNPGNPEKQTNR